MPKASVLQFQNYTVEELFYKRNDVTSKESQFDITPVFSQKLMTTGENLYDMRLSVEISPSEDAPTPFHLKVTIVGHFSYEDEDPNIDPKVKDCLINQNTVAILFPYLRAIVSSVTTNANIPTLTLPVINFTHNVN